MIEKRYTRAKVDEVLFVTALPLLHRIIRLRHLEEPLGGIEANSRLCSVGCGYFVLYLTPELRTAVIEAIVRDRYLDDDVLDYLRWRIPDVACAEITTEDGAQLRLLDLRMDGCFRLGAETDAVHAKDHTAGRALARAIYEQHPDVDGIIFSSRLTGHPVYAIFDRAVHKLRIVSKGLLSELLA